MPQVTLNYRRLDGENSTGELIPKGRVKVTPVRKRNTDDGLLTTKEFSADVGDTVLIYGGTYHFEVTDKHDRTVLSEYRLVPDTGGPFNVGNLAESAQPGKPVLKTEWKAYVDTALAVLPDLVDIDDTIDEIRVDSTAALTAATSASTDASTAVAGLANKVDKVGGKGLSTEDFSTALRTKLLGVDQRANHTGTQGIVTIEGLQGQLDSKAGQQAMNDALVQKVDKITGKGLSTNDYSDSEKAVVASRAPKTALYLTGTNTGNEATAIQAVIDAAGADDIVRLYGTFAISSTVTVKGNLDASGAVFNYTGTGTAVQVGLTASATHRKSIVLPRVVATSKSGTGWASVAGSIGVLIVNMQSCAMLVVPHVQNFETGLVVRGVNAGNVYNNVLIGHLDNNKVNHRVDATGTGWSNQNTYVGGRYSHSSSEGTAVSGVRHVLMATGLPSAPNNNKWVNSSFEGDTPEYHVEAAGSANYWDNCRWEVTGGARVWFRADALDNMIMYGYQSFAVVPTRESGSLRNHILSPRSWTLPLNGNALVTENGTSAANAAVTVMDAGGIVAGADPTTAYTVAMGANTTKFKRAADAFDRVRVDGQNGRIYIGSGAATLARYFGNLGTTAISVNGGNLSPGADNTLDLGQASFAWRYIRAATAVQTGSGATGSRPSAATAGVGASWFDTTIGRPIWSTGSAWVDPVPSTAVYLPSPSGGDDTATVQSAIDGALALGVKCVIVGDRYRINGQVNITGAITLLGSGQGEFYSGLTGTTTQTMIRVTAGSVKIQGFKVTGPQFAAAANQVGVSIEGAVGAPLSGVSVTGLEVTGFGKYGIYASLITDFKIDNNTVKDVAYAGIAVLSGVKGSIDGNVVDNVTQTGYTQSYGIYATHSGDADITSYPLSQQISMSRNRVSRVPNWDGINTHGGRNITVTGNVIVGCKQSIEMVALPIGVSKVPTYAPRQITITGNTIDTLVTDGSTSAGIKLVGAQPSGGGTGSATEYATGVIANNTITGHGAQSDSNSGGIQLYYTQGVVVTGNVGIECSPHLVALYHTNYGFKVTNNTAIDPWSTTHSAPSAVNIASQYNTGDVAGNTVLTAGKSATYVAVRGLSVANQTGNAVTLGTGNDFAGASTPVYDPGTKVLPLGASFGPIASRPAASGVWAGRIYLATDQAGGTSYLCTVDGGFWVWKQLGAGATTGAGTPGAWVPADNGMIACDIDPMLVVSSLLLPSAGVLYLRKIKMATTSPITNVLLGVVTAGASLANAYVGVFDASGTQLGVSADVSTTLQSTGGKTIPLVTPTATQTAGNWVYVGIVVGSATTLPTLRATAAAVGSLGISGFANVRWASISTGLTAMPSSFTPSSVATQSIAAPLLALS